MLPTRPLQVFSSICLLLIVGCGAGVEEDSSASSPSVAIDAELQAKSTPAAEENTSESRHAIQLDEEQKSLPGMVREGAVETAGRIEESVKSVYYESIEVPASEETFRSLRRVFENFKKQTLYANKLLLKECLIEAYELEEELLKLDYADKLPDEKRSMIGKVFRTRKNALANCQIIVEQVQAEKEIEAAFRRQFLSNQPFTLAEVFELANVCKAFRDGIQILENRHDAVHAVVTANEDVQSGINNGRGEPDASTQRLLIESHPYWLHESYRNTPDYGTFITYLFDKYSGSLALQDNLFVLDKIFTEKHRQQFDGIRKELEQKYHFDNFVNESLLRTQGNQSWNPRVLPPLGHVNYAIIFENVKLSSPARTWNTSSGKFYERDNLSSVAFYLGYNFLGTNERGYITDPMGDAGAIKAKGLDSLVRSTLLVYLSPAPKRDDYVKEADGDIEMLEAWLAKSEER